MANMLLAAVSARDEYAEQDPHNASGSDGDRVRSSVVAGPGPRKHGVDGTSVGTRRGGSSAGLVGIEDRRDRCRPGAVGALGRSAQWVSGGGQPRLFRRGGRHLWPGGVSPGAILRRSNAPVGAGPPDRHAGHRWRWCLRSARFQRSASARPQNTRCIHHSLFNFALQDEVLRPLHRGLIAIARHAHGTGRCSSMAGGHGRGRRRVHRSLRRDRPCSSSAGGCAGPHSGPCGGRSWWR